MIWVIYQKIKYKKTIGVQFKKRELPMVYISKSIKCPITNVVVAN
ncbi:hypothetical protein ZONE111905_12840 [Zobellia nedashkovskayae]